MRSECQAFPSIDMCFSGELNRHRRGTTRFWMQSQLSDALPAEMWTRLDVQILHGRRICRPKPLCDRCSIAADCDYFLHVVSKEHAKTDDARRLRTSRR